MSHFDPRDRELCLDGTCVGLIGQNGHCKECGKPGASARLDPRRRGLREEREVAEELEQHIIKGALMAAPEGFQERQLCPDGACIGVIGSDGRCKECGTESLNGISAESSGNQTDGDTDGDTDEDTDGDGWAEVEGDGTESEADERSADRGDGPGGDRGGNADGAFDDRQLCPDGACVGLIGRDGRCRECGKEGSAAV